METLSASLFEVFVYLIPGILITFCFFTYTRGNFKKATNDDTIIKNNFYVILLCLSITFGVANHHLSKTLQFPYRYFKSSNIDSISRSFPALNLVRKRVIKQLSDSTLVNKDEQLYRYCLSYTRENSKGLSLVRRLDRLSALSSFCLNLIFPILGLSLVLIIKSYKTNTKIFNTIHIVTSLFITILLYFTSITYLRAVVNEAYRDYLILTN